MAGMAHGSSGQVSAYQLPYRRFSAEHRGRESFSAARGAAKDLRGTLRKTPPRSASAGSCCSRSSTRIARVRLDDGLSLWRGERPEASAVGMALSASGEGVLSLPASGAHFAYEVLL